MKQKLLKAKQNLQIPQNIEECKDLSTFIKRAWPQIDPQPYVHGWHMDAMAEHLEACAKGDITRLLINIPPGTSKSTATSVFFPAWLWGPYGWPGARFIGASYEQSLATRDNRKTRLLIDSEWYQTHWPTQLTSDQNEKTGFENVKQGFRQSCAVKSMTGKRGDFVIWDDPLSPEKANSELERDTANRVFAETLPTRLNDPEKSVIIVIMQRLHEADVSGYILSRDLGYEHLCLPMEFEADNPCKTSIGFTDPRKNEGDLLFEGRFPKHVVERDKAVMGSFACTPAESPVLMADLGMKPISEVRAGDSVVGFDFPNAVEGRKYSRAHLKPTTVKAVYKYHAPVVRMTLDSGEEIRCTPDHKWFKRPRPERGGAGVYGAAKVGTPLKRVCSPVLEDISPDLVREAGWLAGLFDGDGSVSFKRRWDNCRPIAQIKFYQGAGRNSHVCERLEKALELFGFEYSVGVDNRKDSKTGANYEYRCYTLTGRSLPVMQKFLHMIQPTKWRDRMTEGALGSHWCLGSERVVSIEDDGVEDVFALETETGNYFVWGLASSNSAGQFQQRPVPREGGMFKGAWFNPVAAIPVGTEFVRGWDFAASTKEKSPYTASVLIGRTPEGRFIIAHAERERVNTPRKMLKTTAERDGKKIKISFPQDPGQAGKDQVRSISKDLAGFRFRSSPESGDKATRAEPLAAQCEAGNVDILKGAWNGVFLDEICAFPNGEFMDQVDAASRAFNELNDKQGGSWFWAG